MLIEFKVKNFRSFQNEQVFSLMASSQKQHPKNTFKVENENLTLLKSAAIYGANAAGKSNFMSDFKGLRENIDYEKSYLLGRFGALPRLKSIKR